VRGWEVEHACRRPARLALRVELGGVSFAYSGDNPVDTRAGPSQPMEADLFAVEGIHI